MGLLVDAIVTIMVRKFTETKSTPSYDLGVVQRLAARDRIGYASARNMVIALERLGYSRTHLKSCLAFLTKDNFHVSGRYAIEGTDSLSCWMDAYRCRLTYYPNDDDDDGCRQDDLYIKLSVSGNDEILVTIHSFHDWNRQV